MKILVEQIERSTAKTGNVFLKVSCVTEEKKKAQFYLWDECDSFESLFNQGNRVFDCMFGGDVNFPKISSFSQAAGDPTEFYSFVYPSDDYSLKVFDGLTGTITDPFCKRLLTTIFEMAGPKPYLTIKDAFTVIPAAKAFHHDFRYGLMKHTHEVMSFVDRVCSSPLFDKKLDRDICLTGALLHDVGKVYEYSFDGVNHAEYGTSLEINQIYCASHLYKGAELIAIAFDRLVQSDPSIDSQVNRLKVEHLKHIILSHHLQRDWGAVPKEPQTLEAMLVFLGDYFSATFGKFESIDWTEVSENALFGATSKFNSFFGFTPLIQKLTAEQAAQSV